MLARDDEAIAYFLLDYDGCMASSGLNESNYLEKCAKLMDDIEKRIIEGGYKRIVILSISNRVNAIQDRRGNECNKTASSFKIFPLITEEISKRLKDKGYDVLVECDPMLLSDVHANLPLGTNFELAKHCDLTLKELSQEARKANMPCFDQTKFLLISNAISYVSFRATTSQKAHVFCYDDLGDDHKRLSPSHHNIIGSLVAVLDQDDYLVPTNARIQFIEFRAPFGVVKDNYPIIYGRGVIPLTEEEYRERSMQLALNCLSQDDRGEWLTKKEDIYEFCSLSYDELKGRNEHTECDFLHIEDHLTLYKKARDNNQLHDSITKRASKLKNRFENSMFYQVEFDVSDEEEEEKKVEAGEMVRCRGRIM